MSRLKKWASIGRGGLGSDLVLWNGGDKKAGMARPLRIDYADAYYHVTCRGNEREGHEREIWGSGLLILIVLLV